MTGFRTGYDSNWSISDMYLENKFKWGLFMTQDSANIIKAAQFAWRRDVYDHMRGIEENHSWI